jgi:hypothetical protein
MRGFKGEALAGNEDTEWDGFHLRTPAAIEGIECPH